MIQESTGQTNKDRKRSALIETACNELLTYGVPDTKAKLKRLVRKYLLRQKTAAQSLIFWPTGLLAAGLWERRQEFSSQTAENREGRQESDRIDSALHAYYERWMHKGCPVAYPDDLLAGEVLLSILEVHRTKGQQSDSLFGQDIPAYEKAVGKLAEFGLSYPADEAGSFPYRASQENGLILVDTIGLACPFLYRYGVMYDQREAMELAVKQIVNFLAYGLDAATGLPYHGYSVAALCKYGIIGWGRAVGWLLRGMAGCMITGYGAEKLENAYRELADAAIGYQREDGYFAWQLSAMEGPADTSATAMICAALRQGMALGVLTGEAYGQALQAGTDAVGRSIRNGRLYDCSGECEGPGQYPQRYGAYPWALGPALML